MKFVSTINFTPQGFSHVDQTTERARAFEAAAKKAGITVRELLWTQGAYDGVLFFEAPDDETAAAWMISLGRQGNVHTKTCRAFDASEMDRILAKSV